jgi:hypothetical protein
LTFLENNLIMMAFLCKDVAAITKKIVVQSTLGDGGLL